MPAVFLRLSGSFALAAWLMLCAGCGSSGPPTSHLSGKVTIGGQPIPADASAALTFIPLSGAGDSAVNVAIKEGAYDSPHTPNGDVTVEFYITQEYGPTITSERTGKSYREKRSLVPDKYTAGMPITVGGDDRNKNFDL